MVEGDDFDERAGGVAALDVERAAGFCEAQKEAGRAVFVFWVIFNYFGSLEGLSEFVDRYVAQDGLVDGVLGVFELAGADFAAVLGEVGHGGIITEEWSVKFYMLQIGDLFVGYNGEAVE